MTERSGLSRLLARWGRELLRAARQMVVEEIRRLERRGERSVMVGLVEAVSTDDGVTWADVYCEPIGPRLTARVAHPTRSRAERPRVGDEVVVLLPRGDLLAGGVVIAVLPNGEATELGGVDEDHVVVDTDHDIRETAGGAVEITAGEDITLGVPASGTVRVERAGAATDKAVLNTPLRLHLLTLVAKVDTIGAYLATNSCKAPPPAGSEVTYPDVPIAVVPPVGSSALRVSSAAEV